MIETVLFIPAYGIVEDKISILPAKGKSIFGKIFPVMKSLNPAMARLSPDSLLLTDFDKLNLSLNAIRIRKFIMDTLTKTGVNKMENNEVEKSKALIIVEIIEYVPNSVVIKSIIKKTTGNISAMSFDSGEGLTEKTSPFDTFAQIIDGKAEIVINGKSNFLITGESIVIPAHAPNIVKANERFKMILTIIKSGYE